MSVWLSMNFLRDTRRCVYKPVILGSSMSIPTTLTRLSTVLTHIMSSGSAPLLLYTGPTPNGHKVTVFLEELKAAYGLQYECVAFCLVRARPEVSN